MQSRQNRPREALGLESASDEQFRRRIANELRNSTQQAAAALAIHLGVVKRLAGPWPPAAQEAMGECLQLAQQCEREIRTFSYVLYPRTAEEFGLHSALACYLTAFEKRTGCHITFNIDPRFQKRLPQAIELILFRAVEEFLVTIEKDPAILRHVEVRCRRTSQKVSVKVTAGSRSSTIPRSSISSRNLDSDLIRIHQRVSQLGGQMIVRRSKERIVSTVVFLV